MIRHATTTDHAELVDMYRDASLLQHPFIDPELSVQQPTVPLDQALLFENNGEILGFLALTDQHIHGVFVKADHQNEGIATELINEAKASHAQLQTQCLAEQYEVQQFYHRHGFDVVSQKRHPDWLVPEYVMAWQAR